MFGLWIKFKMLLGLHVFLPISGYSIKSRIMGKLGIRNEVDCYGELYALKRIKYKYFYESNYSLRMRILEGMKNIHQEAKKEYYRAWDVELKRAQKLDSKWN